MYTSMSIVIDLEGQPTELMCSDQPLPDLTDAFDAVETAMQTWPGFQNKMQWIAALVSQTVLGPLGVKIKPIAPGEWKRLPSVRPRVPGAYVSGNTYVIVCRAHTLT